MIVLGLDPGLAATGFGAVKFCNNSPSLLKCGTIKTRAGEDIANRLFQIHRDLQHLIGAINPDLIAIEKAFSMVRYPKAGIILGSVLGIIYLSAFQNDRPMVEISTKEIKNSLAGYGGADKHQVRASVKSLLKSSDIKSFHSSDALAAALAAFFRRPRGRGR